MMRDLRFGARMLRKRPAFALTVVTTLGLGIGLNSAIFSIVNGVLFRQPPVRSPERVVVVTFENPATGSNQSQASALEFMTFRHEGDVFKEIAAASYDDVAMTGQGEPQRISTAQVTPNYFELFAVPARLGRTFTTSEDAPGQQSEAVISYDLWQGRFGGDSGIIGRTMTLAQRPYTVVGVMPAEFQFAFVPCAIWTPASFGPQSLGQDKRDDRTLSVVARLRDGVTIREAQAQATTIIRRLEQDNPTNKDWTARLVVLKEALVEPGVRAAIILLMGVVGFVLLIACANVAGLLLARSAARHHEFAVRAALGAGRWRLVQQLLGESLVLALVGGSLGVLVAFSGVRFLRASLKFDPQTALLAGKIEVNGSVLLFTLILSCLTVLLFGLIPAVQSSRTDLQAGLKEGAPTGSAGTRRAGMRKAVVVGQVTLAMVLMVTTGELVQLVIMEARAQLGFDPRQVLTVDLSLGGTTYADPVRQAAFFKNVVERIQGLPGVEAAGATQELPESLPPRVGFELEGHPASRAEERSLAASYFVSPDYFRVMRIPLLRGRAFSLSDGAGAPKVVIVNQTFVKRFLWRADPIGAFVRTYSGPTRVADSNEIVGVVGDVIDRVGQNEDVAQLYTPFLQKPVSSMVVVIRTDGDPAALAPPVRASIWAMDKDQPVGSIRTMKQVLDHRGAGDRLLGGLCGGFTALALGLAAVGVYGVVSFMVVQRTREIGLRIALGAQKGSVFRLVVGNGMVLALIGTGLGFLLAVPISRVLATADPDSWLRSLLVLTLAPALVMGATLLACYIPARRAMRIDPMMALRYE